MKRNAYILLIFFWIITIIIACSDFENEEYSTWEKKGNPEAWFTSNADNATVAFGNGYRHQVTTGGYDNSSNMTYKLANQPSGMTISSSGLIVWTPTKASQIKIHPEITIFVELPSGYVISQTYNITVTGECTSGNVLSIWSGDQRNSTDTSKILGNITTYTDNSSNPKTASENYNYYSASIHLVNGPSASATKGNMFFYNQYNNTEDVYLFWMFGVAGASVANVVRLDVFSIKNESADNVVVSDDGGETSRQSQEFDNSTSTYDSVYAGRYSYNSCCSDGGVIGPFSGSSYRMFIDISGTSTINSNTLTLGSLDSFSYWSSDGSSFSLGDTDNFTVGYGGSFDCNN